MNKRGIDKAGCIGALVILAIWVIALLDINVWRNLSGAAVWLDITLGVTLTLVVLYLLPTSVKPKED